ncbi:ankyrin [Podospora conica]|nr:ankyrin [Schizothecium conicum]
MGYPQQFYLALHSYTRQGKREALSSVLQIWTSHQLNSTPSPDYRTISEVLYHAIWRGHTDDVQIIFDAGVPPTLRSDTEDYEGPRHTTPLLTAAESGQRDVVRLIWDLVGPEGRLYPSDEDCPARGWSCIGIAAKAGHAATVACFLELWDGWTAIEMRKALIAAAAAWHGDVVGLLLTPAIANYTADGIQDALAACITPSTTLEDDSVLARQRDVVCRLVDAGADPNGNTPPRAWRAGPMLIVAACSAGSLGLLTALLEKGADPNMQDSKNGQTALQQYRLHDRTPSSIATPKALLERGASPGVADHEGETPVHAIALAGTLEELELYLDHCVDANAALRRTNSHGETVLHYAAVGKHMETVKFLIDRGLDVNAVNHNGWTPLLCALMPTNRTRISGAEDIARLLLRHGARADTITAENWTPMHAVASWAYPCRHKEDETVDVRLAKELVSHGASLDTETSVVRGRHATSSQFRGKWGFRMQRFAETSINNGEDTVPNQDTTPHMWAYRTGAMSIFQAILDHWAGN